MKDLNTKKIWTYLVLCFVLTWAGFFTIMFTIGYNSTYSTLAIGACMLFPSISVILTMLITKEGFKNLYLKPKFKGHIKYYLLAWLAPFGFTILGAAFYYLFFPKHFDATMNTYMSQILTTINSTATPDKVITLDQLKLVTSIQFLGALIYAPILNFIPCLGEELGWRGFLQPRLTEKFNGNKIKATLTTGIIWGIWHAPVICMGHNYGTTYKFFPYAGILMMIAFCISIGIFIAFVFYKTESVIPCVITHAIINGFAAGPSLFLATNNPHKLLGPSIAGFLGFLPILIFGIILLCTSFKNKKQQ